MSSVADEYIEPPMFENTFGYTSRKNHTTATRSPQVHGIESFEASFNLVNMHGSPFITTVTTAGGASGLTDPQGQIMSALMGANPKQLNNMKK